MLLHYTGRKTGKHYRQPISYVADGDVLLTPGGGNWTLSLTDNNPVTARIAGKDIRLNPELVREPAEVNVLLQRMAQLNPSLTKFAPRPRAAEGSFAAEPLRNAIAHGFRVVRWRRT
jgi:hypothetical protein